MATTKQLNTQLSTELHAEKPSLKSIKQLLDAGAQLKSQTTEYGTALQRAIRWSSSKLAEFLLPYTDEEQLSFTDNQGKTALHLAVEKQYISLVRKLLERGLDPNQPDDRGPMYPILRATIDKNIDIVGLLIKFGADANVKSDSRDPAIMAMANHQFDLLSLLIGSGATTYGNYNGWGCTR